MSEEECSPVGRRYLISGRVQGVGFRAATRREARKLGLSGYARNLPDGRVEVLACGDAQALAALRAWLLGPGPGAARVDRLDEAAADPVDAGFLIE
jgi:acylphosphatase